MTESAASVGLVGFLFGVFCAYWAQTTDRSAWPWFFFGFTLSAVAGVVLLWKTSMDRIVQQTRADQSLRGPIAQRKDVA